MRKRAPLSIDAERLPRCGELLDRYHPDRQPHIHQRLRGAARKIGVLRDALEVGMESVAEHGEGDRRFAFKQRAAQLLLEPDNGVGQRGLGNAALSGRPRETALLAKRQKIPNLVHFHANPSARCARAGGLPSRSALECEVVHTSPLSFRNIRSSAHDQSIRREGWSCEATIKVRAISIDGSMQMPSSARSWPLECWRWPWRR